MWRDQVWRGRPRPRNARSKCNPPRNIYSLLLVALLGLFAFTPSLLAQRRTASRPTTQHLNPPTPGFASGRQTSRAAHRQHDSSFLALFGDSGFDDLYSSGYPVASQPPTILMQAARDMGGPADYLARPENDREPASNQPLMIELQGGRYVRVSNALPEDEALPLNMAPQSSGSLGSKSSHPARPAASQSNGAPIIAAETPARDLPPVVLVFRDGRTEEVRDYTIADGMLYARGDFYTDGYWNKKIDLSTLDLAKTSQANATRNVKFILPSSPNEVITRP
jgi:hypothetical protein